MCKSTLEIYLIAGFPEKNNARLGIISRPEFWSAIGTTKLRKTKLFDGVCTDIYRKWHKNCRCGMLTNSPVVFTIMCQKWSNTTFSLSLALLVVTSNTYSHLAASSFFSLRPRNKQKLMHGNRQRINFHANYNHYNDRTRPPDPYLPYP